MADEHLLPILTQGAANWNKWRMIEPDTGLDLSSAILPDTDLRGFNFADVNLSRAVLRNARLEGADLSRADLSFANLQGAKLQGANFHGASLLGANLTGADLALVDFSDTKMTGATYDQPELREKAESDRRISQLPSSTPEPEERSLPAAKIYGSDSVSFGAGTSQGDGEVQRVTIAGPPEDFVAVVDCSLTPEQVQSTLTALADYYRKCGGLGFKIRFRLQDAHVEEFARVR